MNKWLINKKTHDHEDLNQNPRSSTLQNKSRPKFLDINEQPKGKI